MRSLSLAFCLVIMFGLPLASHATLWDYSAIGTMPFTDYPTDHPPLVITGHMVIDDQIDDLIDDWTAVQPDPIPPPVGHQYGFQIKEFLLNFGDGKTIFFWPISTKTNRAGWTDLGR